MNSRVLSGMRPTGALHLGHLCGVIANWRKLQTQHDCYFFVADWHALTTDYAAPARLADSADSANYTNYAAAAREMVITWLAAGIDAARSTLFVQSQVPEHAELHVLLSMICPLPKLMQLPTYKEQKANLNRNLDTYGFLGYPLLQSADILAYRAQQIPVGQDQLPHIDFTRDIAQRFNHLYGGGAAFKKAMKQLIRQLDAPARIRLEKNSRRYRQEGDLSALHDALSCIDTLPLSARQRAQLRGYCTYEAEEILPLPEACLTPAAKLPGTDGRKMSKSYNNTINLFDSEHTVEQKTARMQTDPARQRRQDKGEPNNCPVWGLHTHFSDNHTRDWVAEGCRSAAIGCLECKKTLASHINQTLQPLRDKRHDLEKSQLADDIIAAGNQRARTTAGETLQQVRRAMRLLPA